MPTNIEAGEDAGSTVKLDGARFIRWHFKDCTFTYEGGPMPVFEACTFEGYNQIKFGGPAADTIDTLRALDPVMPGLMDNLLRTAVVPPALRN